MHTPVDHEYFMLRLFHFGEFLLFLIFVADDPCHIMCLYGQNDSRVSFLWLTLIINNKNFLMGCITQMSQ